LFKLAFRVAQLHLQLRALLSAQLVQPALRAVLALRAATAPPGPPAFKVRQAIKAHLVLQA
jgi:hypothetical protein